MKKPKKNKLNILIDDEMQFEMSSIREELDVNWSEKIRRFIQLEIKIIKEEKEDEFRNLLCKTFEEIRAGK